MSELTTDLPFPVTFHFTQKVYPDDSIVLSLDHEIADNLIFRFNYPILSKDTELNPIIYSMIRIVLREMAIRDALSKERSLELEDVTIVELNCLNYRYSDPTYFQRVIAMQAHGHAIPESL